MHPRLETPQRPPTAIRSKFAYAILPIVIIATMAFARRAWTADPSQGITAAAALQQLLDGNKLYVADKNVRPDERPSDAAQHPKAVILSCSDSRVTPAIIFDQGVGSLRLAYRFGRDMCRGCDLATDLADGA